MTLALRRSALATWALLAPLPLSCSADKAIEAGTHCDPHPCPNGAQELETKDASGSCSASGSYKPGENEVGAAGECAGTGSCKKVCLYPTCQKGQSLLITPDSFSCATDDVCAAVDCSGHGRCRNNNGQAQCICQGGYVADGTQCVPDDGSTPVGAGGSSGNDGTGGDDTGSGGGSNLGDGGRSTSNPGAGGATSSGGVSGKSPGNTPGTALKLGSLGTDLVKIPDGYVGGSETKDFYQFILPENATVDYEVDVKGANAVVNLYHDKPFIDESMWDATNTATEAAAAIQHIMLEKGTYYLRITPSNGGPLYTLTMSAVLYTPSEPTPEPGETPAAAYDAGTASDNVTEIGGFVGGTDAKDYYLLDLPMNSTLGVSLKPAETSRIILKLFAYSKTTIDETKPLWTVDTAIKNVDQQNLAAGKYYALITVPQGNALYTFDFDTM